jgi:hypothetical protein
MLIHAAGESSPGNLTPGTYAIALTTPDEVSLARLAMQLRRAGVKFSMIREPDAPFGGALMALGLEPGRKEELRRHLSSLPLLR